MQLKSISELEIWDLINASLNEMNLEQERLWDVIKVHPHKWRCSYLGDQHDGFWVVAIIGSTVIWFNDIEDGFNRSPYREYGKIDDYRCNQDELVWQVQNVINQIEDGYDSAGYFSAPKPIA